MALTDHSQSAPENGAPCPMLAYFPAHRCIDRDGIVIPPGSDKVCFAGARVELIGPRAGVIEAAEEIVLQHEQRIWGLPSEAS